MTEFKKYCYYYLELKIEIKDFIKNNYKLIIKFDNLILFKNYVKRYNKIKFCNFFFNNHEYMIKCKAYNILEEYSDYYIDQYLGYDPWEIINSGNIKIYKIFEKLFTEKKRYNIEGIIKTKNKKIINYFNNLLNIEKDEKYIIYLIRYEMNELLIKYIENNNEENNIRLLNKTMIINNFEMVKYLTNKINKKEYITNLYWLKNPDCYFYLTQNNLINKKKYKDWIISKLI